MIPNEDQAILAQQDMFTLAYWWDDLNCWRWPEELPDAEPVGFIPGGRRGKLMDWIVDANGFRACLRYSGYWKDRPEEEFNDFWRGTFEDHKASRERDDKRRVDEAKAAMAARQQ